MAVRKLIVDVFHRLHFVALNIKNNYLSIFVEHSHKLCAILDIHDCGLKYLRFVKTLSFVPTEVKHPQKSRFESHSYCVIVRRALNFGRRIRLRSIKFVNLVQALAIPNLDGTVLAYTH